MDKPVLDMALKGERIEEESVECRLEKVSNAALEENVNVSWLGSISHMKHG